MSGWSEYKFLESVTNLKDAVKFALDREPNTKLTTDAATCLKQGRQFFESAESAAIEIRPLLLQYGIIAMGRAITSCRTLRELNTLVQSHGLSDVSSANARISELRIRVDARGSFQEFNNSVSELESVHFISKQYKQCRKFYNAAGSAEITGKRLSFHDLFSRLPRQRELYAKTFSRDPNVLNSRFSANVRGDFGELQVFVPGHSSIQPAELTEIIAKLAGKYEFLGRTAMISAQCAYGDLQLRFALVTPEIKAELARRGLVRHEASNSYYLEGDIPACPSAWLDDPPPICDSLITGATQDAISTLKGAQLTSYSITYLCSFMLGSLVRYRPQTWVHALSGRVTGDRDLDDKAVALVEEFLASTLRWFPNFTVNAITTRREDILED